MSHKRRKISDLTADDTNALLTKLQQFRFSLDEDDEDLPSGLIDMLQALADKLENVKHCSFSKVDHLTLASMNISVQPLLMLNTKRSEMEELGHNKIYGSLSMEMTQSLIRLVRNHVSTVTEAGCRILINMVLLHVASVMSSGDTAVNIIPEFPIPRTTFTQDSGKRSFSGVVDFLVTKLPAHYTKYLVGDPLIALRNLTSPYTSNIFEAKRDNVRAAVPQAILAAASYCKQQSVPVLQGCISSGEQWLFFVYQSHGGVTGSVHITEEFSLGPVLEGLPLVIGILRDWIDHAYQSKQSYFTEDDPGGTPPLATSPVVESAAPTFHTLRPPDPVTRRMATTTLLSIEQGHLSADNIVTIMDFFHSDIYYADAYLVLADPQADISIRHSWLRRRLEEAAKKR